MSLFWGSLVCAVVLSRTAEPSRESAGPGPEPFLHVDERNFSNRLLMRQEAFEKQNQPLPGHTFNLRVQVNDMQSHQPLSQALVELFVNYTKNSMALSGEDGDALLHVPYHSGLPITVVASKIGFVSALLPYKTNRIPVFSSLTASLLGLNQGNIWLFDDSVLITGKTAEASSQPIVRFPQSLLNLTHSRNVSSVKAFVTVPKWTPTQDDSRNTLGIMNNKSGVIFRLQYHYT